MSGAEASVENQTFTFEQAIALALIIERGMAYREVAAQIGCSPRQTRVLIREALHRAGALLREQQA